MSEALDRTAEIAKLARLLNCDTTRLSYLERAPAAAIRRFREQATDALFEGEGERLHRVAAASKLVPIPVTVPVVQKAVGSLGAAALSGLVDPDRAVKIAAKLPLDFLAEVAIDMDPRRSTAVIAKMPPKTVADVGRKLIDRGEHVTMGRFVGFLPRPSLVAAVNVIGDADMLRTAFVLEDKSRLDELAEIAHDRLPGIVRAAHDEDLWGEALDLVGHLDPRWYGELGDLTAGMGSEVLDAIIRAAHRTHAFDTLLPMTSAMSPESLRAFASAAAAHDPEILREIVGVALASDLWQALLPLAAQLPEQARAVVAARVAEEPDAALARLAQSASEHDMWDSLLPIALAFTPDARRRLAALPLFHDHDVVAAIVATTARHDLWAELLPLADALPDAERRQMVESITGHPDVAQQLVAVLTGDTPQVVWDAVINMRAELPPELAAMVAERARAVGRTAEADALA